MLNKLSHSISSSTFIHFGNSTILTELEYNANKDFNLNKPKNALWASPYTHDKPYKSDWEEYCIRNKMSNKVSEYTLFRLKSNSKILIINSFSDLLSMDEKYIHKELISNDIVTQNILKIENITNDFDGLFISQKGLKECSNIFYEWEVESLALFTSNVVVKLYKDTI